MRNGVRIIDADTHQMEPIDFWEDYIDPAYRDQAPRMGDVPSGRRYVVEGESFVKEHGSYPMTKEFVEASGKPESTEGHRWTA